MLFTPVHDFPLPLHLVPFLLSSAPSSLDALDWGSIISSSHYQTVAAQHLVGQLVWIERSLHQAGWTTVDLMGDGCV